MRSTQTVAAECFASDIEPPYTSEQEMTGMVDDSGRAMLRVHMKATDAAAAAEIDV